MMDEVKGSQKEKKMAGWIANLMIQRGFSFSLNSDVILGLDELVSYFAGREPGMEPESLTQLIHSSLGKNPDIFHRQESDEGIIYRASKRRLVDLLQESKPQIDAAPSLKLPKAPAPAASAAEELPPVTAETAPAPPPVKERKRAGRPATKRAPSMRPKDQVQALENKPVTQQYQLAVLLTTYQLGGQAKAADILERIPVLMKLPEEHQDTYARGPQGQSEEPKYVKYAHSARRFLIKQGELESPSRGIWAITPAGKERLQNEGLIE